MAWDIVECMDGAFEINREGVLRIIRSSVQAEAILANSSVNVETHFFGPNLHSVDTDWTKVRPATDSRSDAEYQEFFLRLANGFTGQSALELLQTEIERKDDAEKTLREMQRQAQRETMDNIEGSVHRGEIALAGAEFVRDASADALMIGATAMSGGTLTPLVAAAIAEAAFFKGAAKYEDTGRFGEAAYEFSSEFVFGVIGVGVRNVIASTPQENQAITKWTLAFVMASAKGVNETVKQTLSGKSMSQTMGRASTKYTDPFISELAKQLIPSKGASWAYPATAVMKYGVKKIVDKVTTPAKAAQDKPQITSTQMTDASVPTPDFITATAIKRLSSQNSP